MNLLARLLGACLLLVVSAGCATIITGSHDNVRIESNPPGAQFETNDGQKGTTPAVVTIADSETLRVSLTAPGYAPAQAQLEPRMSGWVLGNLLLGGIIGLGIDFISGSYRTHDAAISVQMTPAAASQVAATPAAPAPQPPTGAGTRIVDGGATGFIVRADGLIATAYHAVSDAQDISVIFQDGTAARAKLDTWNAQTDVAILKVDRVFTSFLSPATTASIKSGTEVFTFGFPLTDVLGVEAKYTEGAISSLSGFNGNQEFMQITVPLQPGNSGGPVVDDDGAVVGVAVSSASDLWFLKNTGSLPQSIHWASRVENLSALVPDWQVQPITASHADAVERARSSVCRIQTRSSK